MLDDLKRPNISYSALPNGVGVGYKAQHFTDLMQDAAPVEWLEIHAENYMGGGGRPLAQLRHLSERFAISVHGVGLSIGGEGALDADHLARLSHLVGWLNPASLSEHLAWSTHEGAYLNDLLPLPYTADTLSRVCDHIDQLQEAIARPMLLENPSSYLSFDASTMAETEFLGEVAARTGCGLLLDVNNVFISANNLGMDARAYIDAFPVQHIGELHLGGHDEDETQVGAPDPAPLLIDSHGREVANPVWDLLAHTLDRSGPRPLLIEWDADVPDWPVLRGEAVRAAAALATSRVPA